MDEIPRTCVTERNKLVTFGGLKKPYLSRIRHDPRPTAFLLYVSGRLGNCDFRQTLTVAIHLNFKISH